MMTQQTLQQGPGFVNPPRAGDGLVGQPSVQEIPPAYTPRDGKREVSKSLFADRVPIASQHPAHNFKPTKTSFLAKQLRVLGMKQADRAPVEKRLLDLKAEQKAIADKYADALKDWQTARGTLADLERDSFDIGKLLVIVEAELDRRLGEICDAGSFIDDTARQIREHMQTAAAYEVRTDKPMPYSIDECNRIVSEAREEIKLLIGWDGATLSLKPPR